MIERPLYSDTLFKFIHVQPMWQGIRQWQVYRW